MIELTAKFAGAKWLKGITMPTSVEVLGIGCLDNTGLTTLTIPATIKKFNYGIKECDSLKVVTIESTEVTLDFQLQRSSIETLSLPVRLAKMEKFALEGCNKLKKIVVPTKRSNYYKKRLPEELWGLIVEQEPEEKPRKKTSNK